MDSCLGKKYDIVRNLKNVGLEGRMAVFLKNILQDRRFNVRIRNILSEEKVREMDVPQGSVLSVTLFSIKNK